MSTITPAEKCSPGASFSTLRRMNKTGYDAMRIAKQRVVESSRLKKKTKRNVSGGLDLKQLFETYQGKNA